MVIIRVDAASEFIPSFLIFVAPPGTFAANTSYDLNGDNDVDALLINVFPSFEVLGIYYEGVFSLDDMGTHAGDLVSGSVVGRVSAEP